MKEISPHLGVGCCSSVKVCCGSEQINRVEPVVVRGGQVRDDLGSCRFPHWTAQNGVLEVFRIIKTPGTLDGTMKMLPALMGGQVTILASNVVKPATGEPLQGHYMVQFRLKMVLVV